MLLAIIFLASFFRFTFLGQADLVGDESINSFRALGYLDSFATIGQDTSIDWFEDSPWWIKLSFHDHPPLSFILNNIFLNSFGPTPFVARMVSAISGILSALFIYFIGKKLFNQNIGLVAAIIFSINNFAVWIGRTGLQESLLIFLSLASLYYFIKAFEERNYLFLSSLFFGLAILTKYTAIFLLPFFIVFILFKKRGWFKSKKFYLSILLFIIIISPVLIYNFQLFQARGHFDLQLSYLFNLHKLAGWENLPGKSDLTFSQRIIDMPGVFIDLLSPIFLGLLIISLIYFLFLFKKKTAVKYWGMLIIFLSLSLLIILVGPQERFLTLFLPFFSLVVAIFLDFLIKQQKIFYFSMILIVGFFAYEALYSINNFFLFKHAGKEPIAYSSYITKDRGSWGFNGLDKYLNEELEEKSPSIRFGMANPILEDITAKNFEASSGKEEAILIIYDFNIEHGPDTWYLQRRQFYEGWPLITADIFLKEILENGKDFYLQLGFEQFYFIQVTNNTLLRDVEKRSDAGKTLGDSLLQSGVQPVEINNLQGELSLLVYKF